MFPPEGEVGSVEMKMYRGIKCRTEHLNEKFASDPGDYGCGEYWTDNIEFAKIYGDVVEKIITIDSVYHIPNKELSEIIELYRTCKIEDGAEVRLQNCLRLTEDLKSKGYKAVLTKGYENFDVIGVCIFNTQLS